MKNFPALLMVSLLALAGGCASPESRVKQNAAAFAAWPAEVQQRVRAGKVEVGYTKAMARVALGEPDRLVSRTTATGVSEVWVYFDKGPKFSFGLGLGSMRGRGAMGGGVMVGGNDWRDEEVLRLVFDGDWISAIETRK